MIGKTISHYKILDKLGSGGMGTVYKAQDTKLDRFVALKFLPPHLSQDEENKQRFIHEAKAASALNHPNIATIYEIDEADGQMFIAMEYIEGQSLQDIMGTNFTNPQRFSRVIDYATQIAEGLSKTHAKGIIHRDIKPANILVTEEGVVKIVDFGLAKLAGRTMLTKEGTTLGTVAYMSPEQTQGRDVDDRTDIWALAVILYEMLVGKQPFDADYEQAVIYNIMNEEPESVAKLRAETPRELEKVINKGLQKDSDQRYQSIEEMLTDLKKIQTAKTAEPLTQTQSKLKRLRTIAFTVMAFMVLLFALWQFLLDGTLFEGRKSDGDKAESSIGQLAVLPFNNIRHDPETDYLGFALADQIIGSMIYLKNILVRPSSSVRAYQNRDVDAKTAAAELKVDFILTGNFLKQNDLIRLNVELVDVRSNEIVWREPIQVEFQNAFKLQDLVAEKVLKGLQGQFLPDERARIKTDIPKDPLAYEYYLRSISYQHTNEGNSLAIEMLEKSIEIDSTYAPAYAELGFRMYQYAIYALLGEEGFRESENAYLKALALNPELFNALWGLAVLYTDRGRTGEAIVLCKKLLRTNPNNPQPHFLLSYIYRYVGLLEESQEAAQRAVRLDPSNPRFRSAGKSFFFLGEYDKAIKFFEIDEGSTFTFSWKGMALLIQGERDEAIKHLERSIALEPEGHLGFYCGAVKAYAEGRVEDGLEIARKWEQSHPPDAEALYEIAHTYGLLGDQEACLRNLKKAIDSGFFNYVYMERDPFLDGLRDNRRFQKILAEAKAKHEAFKEQFLGSEISSN